MTNEEINEAVAKKLGLTPQLAWECWCKRGYCEHQEGYKDFCHSIEAAWEIVEKLKKNLCGPTLTDKGSHWIFFFTVCGNQFIGESDTAPMAICLAFLKIP